MTLNVGDKGIKVEILQSFLKSKGFYSGVIDGDYGNATKKAVWGYQKSRNLNLDGWAGRETLGRMELEGLSFEPKWVAPNGNQVNKLTNLILEKSNEFIGLVEKKSNAEWDDPTIAGWQKEKSDILVKYMKKIKGWSPGAPYCIAFANSIVVMALEEMNLPTQTFISFASAHVMTQVRNCKLKGILKEEPSLGSIWMAKSGNTDSGHAGIVTKATNLLMNTVEGNTSAGPTASSQQQREGDGIWLRSNISKKGRGNLKTQGFLYPKDILDYLV